jgi:predicted ester cyclase
MNQLKENEDTLRRCVDRFNEGTTRWVDEFYSEAADWTELPSSWAPHGRHGGRDALREKAAAEPKLFPDRRMRILNVVAQGDQVVLELEWRGTSATAAGAIVAGAAIRVRVASFFQLAYAKIIGHVDYPTLAMPLG